MLEIPTDTLKAILASQVATSATYNGCKVILFTNNVFPSKDTVLADLTAATFHGYATSAAVTWGTAFINDAGVPQVLGDLKTFLSTSGGTPNMPETVYGYGLVNGAGDTLLGAERFEEPTTISAAGQAVAVVPYLTAGNQA